uniref:DUF3072 domain-containing protein n=1 Tax=Strongyloides papillosus TaxID=174720 RepID=A0A0N5BRU9_STREA
MNNTNTQQQNSKSPNGKESQKKATMVLGRDVNLLQSKQNMNSNEKSYDDTLKNVDELPEDDESIRNCIEQRK